MNFIQILTFFAKHPELLKLIISLFQGLSGAQKAVVISAALSIMDVDDATAKAITEQLVS